MYAREVDVTRLRKRALLGNGWPQQYQGRVFSEVGSQAISREIRRVQIVDFESSKRDIENREIVIENREILRI
jgi:hypothetical protein